MSYILIKVKYMYTDHLRGSGDIENAETNRYNSEDADQRFILLDFERVPLTCKINVWM